MGKGASNTQNMASCRDSSWVLWASSDARHSRIGQAASRRFQSLEERPAAETSSLSTWTRTADSAVLG